MAKSLVQLGQKRTISTKIDLFDALPTAPTVFDTIIKMANNLQGYVKENSFAHIALMGGGITSNGVKIEEKGHEYYDFVLHYINVSSENPVHCRLQ